MFSSPTSAVIGASDLGLTAAALGVFGFEPLAKSELPADAASALYGLGRAVDELLLAVPGAPSRGTVRLVGPAPTTTPLGDHYATGAHAFDLYARDLQVSVPAAEAADWAAGPVGHVELGPLVMDQVMLTGPDGLVVVLIESQRRRPSLLDTRADASHSEGHSFIWAVEAMDAALPFWAALPGLTVPFDAPIAHPEVNRFMGLPDADAALRMAMVCDEPVSPMRFELLEFVGRGGSTRSSWPLAAGLHAPAFTVDDLDAALDVLASTEATVGPMTAVDTAVHPNARGCSVLAPGGVRFELWESA